MADGLCLDDSVDDEVVIEKTIKDKDYSELMACGTNQKSSMNGGVVVCENVNSFYLNNSDNKLFDKLCVVVGEEEEEEEDDDEDEDDVGVGGAPLRTPSNKIQEIMHDEGFSSSTTAETTTTTTTSCSGGADEDDCRKKRCVDRYDSSESSDSGVAVLSCTDCSGSSTASSDITDPGSPFSTASSHSEDSASSSSQPATKMPPTQTAHHPPWPWSSSNSNNNNSSTEESAPTPKRSIQIEKTVFPKRLKSNEDNTSSKLQSPSCLTTSTTTASSSNNNNNNNNNSNIQNNNNNNNSKVKSCLAPASTTTTTDTFPSPNENNKCINVKKPPITNNITKKSEQQKQGKITEYFKSQIKVMHIIKKDTVLATKSLPIPIKEKPIMLVDQLMHLNGVRVAPSRKIPISPTARKLSSAAAAVENNSSSSNNSSLKNRKLSNHQQHHHQITVPRKILPAPSKLLPENINLTPHHHHHPHLAGFPPTVTLTTVSFPSNLTYLHTKTPKPPDGSAAAAATSSNAPPPPSSPSTNIYVPQFATITNEKLSTIPIINRTPCLNVIHHHSHHHLNHNQPVHQKITTTTINNFNCVKLNATVVPIVKLNALPSRLSSRTASLSVDTAVPTVPNTAKPKLLVSNSNSNEGVTTVIAPKLDAAAIIACRNNDERIIVARRSSVNAAAAATAPTTVEKATPPSPTPAATAVDSDSSGVSSVKDSLAVSVEELTAAAAEQQKSPILSQPKTIRFPPAKQEVKEEIGKDTKATHQLESGVCKWAQCSAQFDTNGALLEHLQVKHVISQATQEQYVCLWLGCKVHGRTSCSRSWLERHVLAHAGTKPFRCIVDGCGQRFNSQLTLERHVNGHFTGDGSQTNSTKKTTETSTSKLFKRNGKKIRFRRQPWSARMFDFIDSGIMEGVQHKLLTITQERTMGQIHNAGNTVNVLSQVVARRVEPDGRVKFLVRWHPTNIVPDEWVSEKEFVQTKLVSIPSLQPSAKDALSTRLFPPDKRNEKRRRKPISKQQT